MASICRPLWLHLASVWRLSEGVPFWLSFLFLLGRLVDQNGAHFGIIFQHISCVFLNAFFVSVFGIILSHVGVVFGSFLDAFCQLFGRLRGNVHVSKIDTPLSVLLGFWALGVTPGGIFSLLFHAFSQTSAGECFRPRFSSISGSGFQWFWGLKSVENEVWKWSLLACPPGILDMRLEVRVGRKLALTYLGCGPTTVDRIQDKGYRIGYRINDTSIIVHPVLQE